MIYKSQINFGDFAFPFKPKIGVEGWYIVKIKDAILYTNGEWCDPNTHITMRAKIVIATLAMVGTWLKAKEETYREVWVNLADGEFINHDETPGLEFRAHHAFRITNCEDVFSRIREKLAGESDPEQLPDNETENKPR